LTPKAAGCVFLDRGLTSQVPWLEAEPGLEQLGRAHKKRLFRLLGQPFDIVFKRTSFLARFFLLPILYEPAA